MALADRVVRDPERLALPLDLRVSWIAKRNLRA
jgi:hypothetical protein